MSPTPLTLDEVAEAGLKFYWYLARFTAENPGALTDEEECALDVDLSDVLDRIRRILICGDCGRAPCRCQEES